MGSGKKFLLVGEMSEALEELRKKTKFKYANDCPVFRESVVKKNLDSYLEEEKKAVSLEEVFPQELWLDVDDVQTITPPVCRAA